MEGETELEGRLKKVRIKLIMIGICLIFLGVYSLIKEKKDQTKNTSQEAFNQYVTTFFRESASENEITKHYLLENSEKYGVKQSQDLYPVMNEKNILNEKIRISRELEKLKKNQTKGINEKTTKYIYDFVGLLKKTEKSVHVSLL